MKQNILYIFFILIFLNNITAQSFRQLALESNVSTVVNSELDPFNGLNHYFTETSAHLGILTNLTEHWYIGLNYNHIWTHYNGLINGSFFMVGATGRYELPITDKFNIYASVMLETGNYCTCADTVFNVIGLPYQKPKLGYVGFGFGARYPIYKGLQIQLGINVYRILASKIPTEHYPQPFLGLQWRL